ncbi:MAG: hypothetical protein IJY27_03840 [Clostridia bacterium]|nr:hypothetical protein [Clostridia bacterium]
MDNKNVSACDIEPCRLLSLAETYINDCLENERLPNLAGLCRRLGMSVEAFGQLPEQYREQVARIRDALEDEALNSSKPAALLGSYLKKRLGYGDEDEPRDDSLTVIFDHNSERDSE